MSCVPILRRFICTSADTAIRTSLAESKTPLQAGVPSAAVPPPAIEFNTAQVEQIMLETRLRTGLDLSILSPRASAGVPRLAARGLIDLIDGRLVLTRSGRLLADAVVRELVD